LRKSRIAAFGAIGISAALALSACSGSGGSSSSSSGGDKGKTLTVWVMQDDLSTKTIDAINKKFTAETGAKVKIQTQQWADITTKLTTALASSNAPDVIDVGNTQVPTFAATGGLKDLTSSKKTLEAGQSWLSGLEDPATIDGKLYGVPSFAGARAVIYNKKTWADAGITTVPTTYEELTADLDKIKAKNTASDFSPFYLPGQFWYAGMQFVWDAGGEIATQKGGKWSGGFSTPEAQQGLADYKEFQNAYSSQASRTLNTDQPDENTIFASGKAAAELGTSAYIPKILADNPQLTADDIGTFAFPGKSGKNQPAMLGGSVWSVAQKSANADLAVKWVTIAASPEIQNDYVFKVDGWIPNSNEGIKSAEAGDLPASQKGFFDAALISKATPAAANWATVEGDNSITQFFQQIATGSDSVSAAAKSFDAHIASVLNGNQ
jgi:N,N'-diacetylchitobiose transport system substrate-binding protein